MVVAPAFTGGQRVDSCPCLLTNEMDGVGRFTAWHTNQEVIRLDVSVNKGLFMDSLDAGNLKKGG